jgi:endonuclease/exonuclease/phosphatase family metal-dependent hydrolase
MDLNVISWNVNFIHDNWSNRLININNRLQEEQKTTDIICLQEATLPFSDTFTTIYNCLKGTDLKYFASQEMFLEKEYIYNILKKYFPRYKDFVIFCFEKIMDKLLYLCTLVNSYFGEDIKRLYFNHPFAIIVLVLCCPIIFAGQWAFIGMLSIINPKIQCKLKCKYVGRTIQYLDFVYNKKKIILVNIHLTPGNREYQKNKRRREIKKIIEFFKDNPNVILCGDFNSLPKSSVVKYLKNSGYKSCCEIIHKKNLFTFPVDNLTKCIDYFFIKGDISVKKYELFGTIDETDHKGIKTTFVV